MLEWPVTISTKAAIYNRQGEVLTIQRSSNDRHAPGMDEFPGGKADGVGSREDNLLREIREETGLELVQIIGILGWVLEFSRHRKRFYLTFFYQCSLINDQEVTLSSEHSSWKWVTPEKLNPKELTPTLRIFLRKYPTFALSP